MEHTPGPWKWQGEDYRGGWGWQLLTGPRGEGLLCGPGRADAPPYKNLQANESIDPTYCKTGLMANDDESAPPVHVQEANARLIAAAPALLSACEEALITVTERCNIERINPDASPTVLCLRKAIEEATA